MHIAIIFQLGFDWFIVFMAQSSSSRVLFIFVGKRDLYRNETFNVAFTY
jgi:hypothetical protein